MDDCISVDVLCDNNKVSITIHKEYRGFQPALRNIKGLQSIWKTDARKEHLLLDRKAIDRTITRIAHENP
jgi:hypothetical protein